jgi:hypothetical protein
MMVQGVSVWSVLVAGVAAFMVGGIWYAAVFGQAWAVANGYGQDQLSAMAKKQGRNFGIFFLVDLLMAAVVAALVVKLGVSTAIGGALLGLALWAGVALPIAASNKAANNKSLNAFLIDAGYELVVLLIVGAIAGAWH